MYIASRLNVRGISRALARLCIYAVWSRPLLVAYNTLLENSCHASFMIVAIPIVAEVVKKNYGYFSSVHRSQNIYMDYVSTVVEKDKCHCYRLREMS